MKNENNLASTYHEWGDSWPYWIELNQAERFIIDFVYTWSRCRLISKEKYGTIRYEAIFPPFGGYFYNHGNWIDRILSVFGKKTVKVSNNKEYTYQKYIWQNSKLYYWWACLGVLILEIAIKQACNKWPQCKEEILEDWLYFKQQYKD